MQHLASATVCTTLVIEVGTYIVISLALVLILAVSLAFFLAFVIVFSFALALVSLPLLSDLLGLVDDLLLMGVHTAHAVRTRLSVVEIEARKQLLLFGGRGESSRHQIVFVKPTRLLALFANTRFFEQRVALISTSLVRFVGIPPWKTIHLLHKISLLQLRDVSDLGQKGGVHVCGFRRTLEVEHKIALNREERPMPFDIFRVLHLFEVRVELHVRNAFILSELTIVQEENQTFTKHETTLREGLTHDCETPGEISFDDLQQHIRKLRTQSTMLVEN